MITYSFYPLKQEFYPFEEEWYLTSCDISEDEQSELELTLPPLLTAPDGSFYPYNIYNAAFWGSDKIKVLKLSSSTTSIGAYAFYRSNIQEFYLYSNIQEVNSTAFENIEKEFKIYVPLGWKNRFANEAWYNALGGKEKWNDILLEGDYSISEGKIVPPLYRAGQLVKDMSVSAEAEKIGLMPWYATSYKDENGNTISTVGGSGNKKISITQDGIIIGSIEGKHLYRSDKNSDLSKAGIGIASNNEPKVFASWKTNSLYRIDNNTLYINAKRVESLALQDANAITSITIGPDVEYISPFAFKGCKKIISVLIDIDNKRFEKKEDCMVINTQTKDLCLLYNLSSLNINKVNTILKYMISIPAYCFSNQTQLTEALIIPNNIKHIGTGAFQNCSGINSVSISARNNYKDVLIIDDYAFNGCELTNIVIPGGAIKAKNQSFGGQTSSGTVLNINSGQNKNINQITSSTFKNNKGENILQVINIYDSDDIINKYKEDKNWAIYLNSVETFTAGGEIKIPDGVTKIDATWGFNNNPYIKKVTIPNTIVELNQAFKGCTSLEEVVFEEDTGNNMQLTIGYQSFYDCISLYKIDFPSRVKEISSNAFCNCKKIVQIYDEGAKCQATYKDFGGLGNQWVYIPIQGMLNGFSNEYLKNYAIWGEAVNNDNYKTNENCEKIRDFIFHGDAFGRLFNYCPSTRCYCNGSEGHEAFLQTCEAEDKTKTIYFTCDVLQLSGNIIKSIIWNDSQKMYNYNFDSIVWPNNNEASLEAVIVHQDLNNNQEIIIPETLTNTISPIYIYNHFLENNKLVKKLTIPQSIQYIGYEAFKNCEAIQQINYNAESAELVWASGYNYSDDKYYSLAFANCGYNATLNIGATCTKICNSFMRTNPHAGIGQDIPSIAEIIVNKNDNNQITQFTISPFAFYGLRTLQTLVIYHDADIIELPYGAIWGENQTTENRAFYGCQKLYDVYLYGEEKDINSKFIKKQQGPNKSYIVNYAENIHINAEEIQTFTYQILTDAGILTFYKGEKQDKLIDYEGDDFEIDFSKLAIQQPCIIDTNTFSEEDQLEKIILVGANKITTLGNGSFQKTGIKEITIPPSITSIGSDCFKECKQLEKVEFDSKNSITVLENSIFYKCVALNKVTLSNNINHIKNNVFEGCSNLTYLELPASVQKVENGSLRIGSNNNKTIIKILRTENIVQAGKDNIVNASWLEKILVPAHLLEEYKNATNWSKFADYFEGY